MSGIMETSHGVEQVQCQEFDAFSKVPLVFFHIPSTVRRQVALTALIVFWTKVRHTVILGNFWSAVCSNELFKEEQS